MEFIFLYSPIASIHAPYSDLFIASIVTIAGHAVGMYM